MNTRSSNTQMAAILLLALVAATSCQTRQTEKVNAVTSEQIEQSGPISKPSDPTPEQPDPTPEQPESGETRVATFGAGCFWCVEAVFQQLEGVLSVESGYCGGDVENPTYQQICSGTTGHAEVCRIRFDPSKITFDEMLKVFWETHDPTTLNRQGNDEGTQYRSVIFYHDKEQKALAEQRKKQLDAAGAWPDPIVTEISPVAPFYKAEKYHQNYYNDNPTQGYCQYVIRPKVDKVRSVFKDRLKTQD